MNTQKQYAFALALVALLQVVQVNAGNTAQAPLLLGSTLHDLLQWADGN